MNSESMSIIECIMYVSSIAILAVCFSLGFLYLMYVLFSKDSDEYKDWDKDKHK